MVVGVESVSIISYLLAVGELVRNPNARAWFLTVAMTTVPDFEQSHYLGWQEMNLRAPPVYLHHTSSPLHHSTRFNANQAPKLLKSGNADAASASNLL